MKGESMTEVANEVTTTIEEYSKTNAALAVLRQRYEQATYDVTTKAGLAEAVKARAELRGYRVELEKIRVRLKAPALKRTQEIDSEARRITAALTALEDPIDAQIKAEETRKENERLAAERAEQERIAAEERARREAEESKLAAERTEIARRQAELDKAEAERVAKEREAQRLIDEQARQARLKVEEEERAARLAREEQDRLARQAREEEERKAKAIRDEQERQAKVEREAREAEFQRAAQVLREEQERMDAERRKVEEEERRVRAMKEAQEREAQRLLNEQVDARALLEQFVTRFGHLKEFAKITKAIKAFLGEAHD